MLIQPILLGTIGVAILFTVLATGYYVYYLYTRVKNAEQKSLAAATDKTRFIMLMGHEIRNPLNAILGMSELLSQEVSSPEQREHLLVVRGAVDNLLMVATNLLGFFADTSAQFPRQNTVVHLPTLMASIQQSMAPFAFEKRLHLDFHIETGSPAEIETDVHHVRQIICNILAHAIGITDHGHVELTVHAVKTTDAESVTTLNITVMDSGPTLSTSATTALFEPFGLYDRFPGDNPPGTGLNMHNARAFSKLLGGNVIYRAHATTGNIYEIVLPVRLLNITTAEPDPALPNDNVAQFDDLYVRHRIQLKQQRILIAEDQRSNQQMVAGILKRAGHSVHIAKNGDEALESLGNEDFDIAVIDLRLPGTSGIDVIKLGRFTESARRRTVPFIVLTGEASEKIRQDCYAAGAAAFLAKPVAAQRLLDTLLAVSERAVRDTLSRSPLIQTAIDLEKVKKITDTAARDSIAPGLITENLRDALRYVAEIEIAGAVQDWPCVRQRVRAIRGIAYLIGATQLFDVCRRITVLPDSTLEIAWPKLADDLTHRLEEARKTLEILFQQSQAV